MLDDQALMQALNSTPVVDGRRRDLWRDDHEVDRWAREHGGDGGDAERRWLRTARDALQAVESGTPAEPRLRRILAGVRKVPRPGPSGIEWQVEMPPERRTAVELVLAWADVKERLPGRLRPCGNPDCRLFLLDRSRANTARWCSMKTCGNRLKARRHQARTRETGTETGTGTGTGTETS
ncbi:CGNR zinc finger domain-containing protein [Streptomyces sp. WMMB303]|uniref:CGNR zinc finger domain-containing protein n=1 Tax=Streptomyces sp. WMMB303 TaxID=3034154 RepID=UPI0023ED6212|nr:CGNR zinc finger domain-containing protein [Streptomyces sp. WMMB303]MDF4251835.1 CGNR zinc finger domain-containing protein [Streptomyces sp. WMMB303]